RQIVLALVILLIFGILCQSASAKDKYIWPLKKRFGLSGTFGEYRSTRLHTGIDLKTATVTGLSVRAVADGVIYRLSVNYRGYGRALYIRHADGLISVYGHLESFENHKLGLENIVAKKRKETGERYPGNIFINVPVKRGQIVAFSGESGFGLPHLHFELRRGESTPINPLSILEQTDVSKPVIKRLILRPVGPDSLIDGGHDDVEIRLKKPKSEKTYTAKEIPTITGEFVVLANAYDTVAAGNQCSVHKLELFADGELVYSISLDELDYSGSSGRGGLLFDNRYAYFSPPSYVYQLHNRYAADIPWEDSAVNRGILNFSEMPGKHKLTVKVWDDAGASATAEIDVVAGEQVLQKKKPPTLLKASENESMPLIQVWDDFAEVWLPVDKGAGPNPAETVQFFADGLGGGNIRLNLLEKGPDYISAALAANGTLRGRISLSIARTNESGALEWKSVPSDLYIIPKEGGVIEANDLRAEFPEGALYEDQLFQVVNAPSKEVSGVPAVGGLVKKVLPEGIPLEKDVVVSFECPTDLPARDVARCGLYEYNAKRSEWKYRGNERIGERSVGYGVRYLSTFGLLVDRVPPVIRLQIPTGSKPLKKHGNRLVVSITDIGSGIDYRTVVATIDGIVIDAEYDPDRKLLKGSFDLQNPTGRHRLLINASDRAGNPATPLDVTFR
ncbi:MAG: M23 family metallopeptidase, partial [Candidatus Coatesbacteria bacterium]|nr:M23 family metallopeptidase [Candidatus Coatesbacteria bacterium]